MFTEAFGKLADSGKSKVDFMKKSPLRYFVAAMLAGMFISFGSIVSMSTSGLFAGIAAPYAKLLAGLMFCAALSLVIMAGCELFTGNNLSVTAAFLTKKVSLLQLLALFALCYAGNLAGSVITMGIYKLSGAASSGTLESLAALCSAKVQQGFMPLFIKGVLCNICVCLAVWCATKMTSESGKLIMVIWCILIFMVSGFEHSVANMGMLSLGMMEKVITLGQTVHNLVPVTLGNMVGGIVFVALPYWFMAKEK